MRTKCILYLFYEEFLQPLFHIWMLSFYFHSYDTFLNPSLLILTTVVGARCLANLFQRVTI